MRKTEKITSAEAKKMQLQADEKSTFVLVRYLGYGKTSQNTYFSGDLKRYFSSLNTWYRFMEKSTVYPSFEVRLDRNLKIRSAHR